MPARDVAIYISDAIHSVISQTYSNWELIIIENGSKDDTLKIIKEFTDTRIKIIQSEKTGLSHARNIGLNVFQGEFICFLDADDKLPTRSLESRISHFIKFPEITFLDGKVTTYNVDFSIILREWAPEFKGRASNEMALLTPRCFCGITWMIRVRPNMDFSFDESWTHLEDRVFFQRIAQYGIYDYLDQQVYIIRRRTGSLMTNHFELEKAYLRFMSYVKDLKLLSDDAILEERKIFHILFFKTYLKQLLLLKAFRHLYLFFRIKLGLQ